MLNIILAVAQAIVALIGAYLGVHVTLHPPGESAKKSRAYKVGFIACGVVATVLIAVQAYRNDTSQTALQRQLGRIEHNTTEPPKVQVNVPPAQVQFLPSPQLEKIVPPVPTVKELERQIDDIKLHDLFLSDLSNGSYSQHFGQLSITGTDNTTKKETIFQAEFDEIKNPIDRARLITYYVPDSPFAYDICIYLSKQKSFVLEKTPQFDFESRTPGESSTISTKDLPFTGRVYVYHETFLSPEQTVALTKIYRDQDQYVVFRGSEYLSSKKLEMKVVKLRAQAQK